MKTTFISTNSISSATRLALMKVQQRLADAQQEMTTGRYADVGQSLGFRTGQAISLRQEQTRLQTIVETNGVVSSRLESTQAALQDLVDAAGSFVDQALASRVGGSNTAVVQKEAESALDTFLGTMNTTFGGGHLFAGVNSDVKPLASYYGSPVPANRQGVADAFFAAFGVTQSDPAVQNISAADMQTFLDTGFADLFNDPSWSTDWSSASNQNVRNRISTNELIETSVNANEDAFRQLAKAYTMVADLGVEHLEEGVFQTVVDQAFKDATEAIHKLGELQSRLGVAQQRTKGASERMSLQADIITKQIRSFENIDPNEAATRVSELMTQIETSYALTARIMGLSILKYL